MGSGSERVRHFRNFDFMRLSAAASVIFSHAFLLAQGTENNEPFRRLTGDILGIYGVAVFFVVSGFLITGSACASRSVADYVLKRALRIYPALIVCLLLTATILGTIFTRWDRLHFLTSLTPLKYTLRGALRPLHAWDVPSVIFYADGGRYGDGLNGSLWTIECELTCYAVIAVLMIAKALRWPALLAAFIPLLAFALRKDLYQLVPASEPLSNLIYISPPFFAGGLIFLWWRAYGKLPLWPLLPCALVFVGAAFERRLFDLFSIYGAYPLLLLATSARIRLPELKRIGDISYGVYLYGWPVEQAIVAAHGGPGKISPLMLFVEAFLTASVLGYLSWHLVEKRALALKKWRWRRTDDTGDGGQPSSAIVTATAMAAEISATAP